MCPGEAAAADEARIEGNTDVYDDIVHTPTEHEEPAAS